ncbi:MAG: putative DNA binding domain-containing protein [Spirochaetales bacterium]|nr:putative DNA binding domain-containing protein [Desulfobacterales bacterium]MCK5675068.1 putative DNA binding domain-containing protein [Spirochaetales bacterium]
MDKNIQTLIKKGESESLEFKTSFGKETMETLSAFANSNGGTVLIGINDKGKIIGVDTTQESIQQWINQIKNSTISIKDSVTIRDDLFSEVKTCIEFMRKHINKRFIITGKPEREEVWDYPLEAIREIVINMIVHRDYRAQGDSTIKIENYKRYNFSKIGIFGSVARDSAHESSDIDIIIELNSPDLFLLGTIKYELKEKVDIIRLRNGMNAFLKSRIDKEAIYV